MKVIETTTLTEIQKEGILKLWNQEYPEKLKYDDVSGFESYLGNLKDQRHFLLLSEANEILGWSFSFVRDGERWFAMILDSSIQRLGYGTLLLNKVRQEEIKLNGWVIDHGQDKKQNGEFYKSPLNFYLKNGFILLPAIRLELDKMSAVKIEWTK